MARRKLVAGNWKMHGLASDLGEIAQISMAAQAADGTDVALCVPATLIHRAVAAVPGFTIGGQDLHANEKGAHTGDISAAMLKDAGATMVIVGHSERRQDHGEGDAIVAAKAAAGLAAGLHVILCVGESLEIREAGNATRFVSDQLKASLPSLSDAAGRLSIAYEPIWAIGTGKVAGSDEITQMHDVLRASLGEILSPEVAESTLLLYGGSVKADNAADILGLANVDGALVGGASLTAAQFGPIIAAAENAAHSA